MTVASNFFFGSGHMTYDLLVIPGVGKYGGNQSLMLSKAMSRELLEVWKESKNTTITYNNN